MTKVHKSRDGGKALCEGDVQTRGDIAVMLKEWHGVTCKRCLAKRPKEKKRG